MVLLSVLLLAALLAFFIKIGRVCLVGLHNHANKDDHDHQHKIFDFVADSTLYCFTFKFGCHIPRVLYIKGAGI
jgi:hypothetical protein